MKILTELPTPENFYLQLVREGLKIEDPANPRDHMLIPTGLILLPNPKNNAVIPPRVILAVLIGEKAYPVTLNEQEVREFAQFSTNQADNLRVQEETLRRDRGLETRFQVIDREDQEHGAERDRAERLRLRQEARRTGEYLIGEGRAHRVTPQAQLKTKRLFLEQEQDEL
jgi:hypothetical protein